MRFSSIVAAALLAFTMGATAAPVYEVHDLQARGGGGTWVKVGDVYILSNEQNQIVSAVSTGGGNTQANGAQNQGSGSAYAGGDQTIKTPPAPPAKPGKPPKGGNH